MFFVDHAKIIQNWIFINNYYNSIEREKYSYLIRFWMISVAIVIHFQMFDAIQFCMILYLRKHPSSDVSCHPVLDGVSNIVAGIQVWMI